LLEVVQEADSAGAPVDNEMLAAALDIPLTAVALALEEAKARSLIWGVRSGRQPAPWYAELEVTVQGRRFLTNRGRP
jgi:hypothetical protein